VRQKICLATKIMLCDKKYVLLQKICRATKIMSCDNNYVVRQKICRATKNMSCYTKYVVRQKYVLLQKFGRATKIRSDDKKYVVRQKICCATKVRLGDKNSVGQHKNCVSCKFLFFSMRPRSFLIKNGKIQERGFPKIKSVRNIAFKVSF
jgi:hypothetical protein